MPNNLGDLGTPDPPADPNPPPLDDPDPIITPQDVRDAGHCARGLKAWLINYGIDPALFFSNQVRASEMLATGDANGIRVVEMTIARRAGV